MSENLLNKWTEVTGNLAWAKQRTLLDTLNLVAEGKVKVVFGANDFNGSPCLINAVGCMVKDQDEQPMDNEPALVGLFDQICREVFAPAGIVKDSRTGFLTDLAAETLVRFFAPLKPVPDFGIAEQAKYVEPKIGVLEAELKDLESEPQYSIEQKNEIRQAAGLPPLNE